MLGTINSENRDFGKYRVITPVVSIKTNVFKFLTKLTLYVLLKPGLSYINRRIKFLKESKNLKIEILDLVR